MNHVHRISDSKLNSVVDHGLVCIWWHVSIIKLRELQVIDFVFYLRTISYALEKLKNYITHKRFLYFFFVNFTPDKRNVQNCIWIDHQFHYYCYCYGYITLFLLIIWYSDIIMLITFICTQTLKVHMYRDHRNKKCKNKSCICSHVWMCVLLLKALYLPIGTLFLWTNWCIMLQAISKTWILCCPF